MPENDLIDVHQSYHDSYGKIRTDSMASRAIDALIAARLIKLLVTPFKKTEGISNLVS